MAEPDYIRWFEDLDMRDVGLVGGKNASLGEMTRALGAAGIAVPAGFATTADAYRAFLEANDLAAKIEELLAELDRPRRAPKIGRSIRRHVRKGTLPPALEEQIRRAYRELATRQGEPDLAVAVRSSATAEDLPEASFAGQQESFLDVRGEAAVIAATRECFASLFTDRAIAYRIEHGFGHLDVALSVGVQRMVRAAGAGAGVMFTLDTETGFPHVVVIDAAPGTGEDLVQGRVDPDSYTVFKPLLDTPAVEPILDKRLGERSDAGDGRADAPRFVLSDREILQLARWGVAIEGHYGKPMDVEWAKDAAEDRLYIVQARPETVHSRRAAGALRSYRLLERGRELLRGTAVGDRIAAGPVRVLHRVAQADRFPEGGILVTGQTDPDWVPVMRKAAAIVTDHGGRTSHAAIVSRELGIPAVIGTGDATSHLADDQEVTVSCANGESGHVYEGRLEFATEDVDLGSLAEPPVRLMINVASPGTAFRWWQLPVRGVGLLRTEFLVTDRIRAHPLALLRFEEIEDKADKDAIRRLTRGHPSREEFFVDRMARGIATVAASRHPDPVIVRTSDFKTNEYAQLIGGRRFEPREENPMLGFRGAARYCSDRYRDAFALECAAIVRARDRIGLDNIAVMIPFVRTVAEADAVLHELAANGLVRGERGLRVHMMCEVPSNVVRVEEFAARFDGLSIGSNDLTQLMLGVDRDSELLAELFDEQDEAVRRTIEDVIWRAQAAGCPVGFCGQGPSDDPDFARFLVDSGIDSISLNPDSVVDVLRSLADHQGARR